MSGTRGGFVTYGKVAGILMLDSRIPRLPGDPGHAQTFSFPVAYESIGGLPFLDLVEARRDRLGLAIAAARRLESEGVSFVAADCGLFSIFQEAIAAELSIPFLGSALSLIPFLGSFLARETSIGLLTGHTGLLSELHFRAAGADPSRVVMAGMEHSEEFKRVVIERGEVLSKELLCEGVKEATLALVQKARAEQRRLGAVVIECTNLISFREEIQELAGVPVYDLVSLIEFHAGGFAARPFAETHQSFRNRRP